MIVQKELFGEDKHIEFKAEISKKHEKFLKDIIAFANTSGGKTIVGVEDETGKVVGLGDQNPFKLSDAISNMISDACTAAIWILPPFRSPFMMTAWKWILRECCMMV